MALTAGVGNLQVVNAGADVIGRQDVMFSMTVGAGWQIGFYTGYFR
jgi:hypothetical protein